MGHSSTEGLGVVERICRVGRVENGMQWSCREAKGGPRRRRIARWQDCPATAPPTSSSPASDLECIGDPITFTPAACGAYPNIDSRLPPNETWNGHIYEGHHGPSGSGSSQQHMGGSGASYGHHGPSGSGSSQQHMGGSGPSYGHHGSAHSVAPTSLAELGGGWAFQRRQGIADRPVQRPF